MRPYTVPTQPRGRTLEPETQKESKGDAQAAYRPSSQTEGHAMGPHNRSQHAEDFPWIPHLHVRAIHSDLSVKAARAQQRLIQHIRPVGRRDDDDASVPLHHPCHFDNRYAVSATVKELLACNALLTQVARSTHPPTCNRSVRRRKCKHCAPRSHPFQ